MGSKLEKPGVLSTGPKVSSLSRDRFRSDETGHGKLEVIGMGFGQGIGAC